MMDNQSAEDVELENALLEAFAEEEDDKVDDSGAEKRMKVNHAPKNTDANNVDDNNEDTSSPSPSGSIGGLSDAVLYRILCCLPPEDLCTLCCCSSFFNYVASDTVLWQRLYHSRWCNNSATTDHQAGDDKEEEDDQYDADTNWKRSYARRDAAEIQEAASSAPNEHENAFKQMIVAKRSEPLGLSHCDAIIAQQGAAKDKPTTEAQLFTRVTEFRKQHGLQQPTCPDSKQKQKRSTSCTCTATNRKYVHLHGTNVWICERCGHVHHCGKESCREAQLDKSTNMPVCPISGRCFERFMSEYEEAALEGGGGVGDGDGRQQANDDWNAEDHVGGRLGRAFFAGYNAVDEQEMLYKFGIKF